MRVRGFLLGGTAGRTTLSGEGLQHQDGNSHVLALSVPNLRAYDPAFAYEIAIIIQDGIRRMYKEGESIFYYITLMNEPYAMPAMPGDVKDGILKGMYRFRASDIKKPKLRANSSAAAPFCARRYKLRTSWAKNMVLPPTSWSVTSYKALYNDGIEAERWNRLHPGARQKRVPYVTQQLEDAPGVLVAASDYLKTLPNMISQWMPRRWPHSAPTASAAAKGASPCAISSKSMRARSFWLRSMNCIRTEKSSATSLTEPSKTWVSILTSRTRLFPNRATYDPAICNTSLGLIRPVAKSATMRPLAARKSYALSSFGRTHATCAKAVGAISVSAISAAKKRISSRLCVSA
jgi:hypothetical protein